MRVFFLFFIFYSNTLFSQSSIYDLSITTISGKSLSLSEYKGNKILIATVSPGNLQREGAFSYWDSLQAANPKVALILIPANDFSSTTEPVVLENKSGNIVISEGTEVKKDKGSTQNPVMQWLTDSEKNLHFNADVQTDVQLYVVSESGVLYAVLDKGASQQVVNTVLKQADIKQQDVTQ